MNDNVISIGTRKSFAEEQAAKEATQAAIAAELTEELKLAQDATLDTIDKIRAMVAEGRAGGLIIMTQDLHTGLFCSDVVMHKDVIDRKDLFSWAGHMAVLSAEVTQMATMAPVMLVDGTICDPEAEMIEEGYL